MKKSQAGLTIIELLVVVIVFVFLPAWVVNAYKFSQCDFESPYKCEVIHGVGIIPAFSIFTVWVGTDE